jgi:rRNA small subunit aminocarboxypropyltransferase
MRAQVLMYKQDDPAKCTAAKLVRFGLAESIRFVRPDAILLDPFSKNVLTSSDSVYCKSICAIDCSWEKAQVLFAKSKLKRHSRRRLPALLAGNPINYSKISKLTTAEALAASLFILGCRKMSESLLAKFKWGHTFLELNLGILDDYAKAPSDNDIRVLERKYFPQVY